MNGFTLLVSMSILLTSFSIVMAQEDGYNNEKGSGTACIVNGSHCSCHYCKCEKGWVHCEAEEGDNHGYGKKFCYGSTEGQYCNCDYCKCSQGYGATGHEGSCGGGNRK